MKICESAHFQENIPSQIQGLIVMSMKYKKNTLEWNWMSLIYLQIYKFQPQLPVACLTRKINANNVLVCCTSVKTLINT